MKSVLVVGGGPAGLVAAKTLIHTTPGKFKVTLFETAERVGGMWRVQRGEDGLRCSPDMRTNLSKYTVAFSDLCWESIHLGDEDRSQTDKKAPMFPRAWQVGEYLREYARRFIPTGIIYCNRAVTRAERTESDPQRWRVTSADNNSNVTHHDEYDYLIVASGFYDRTGSTLTQLYQSNPEIAWKVQHSANFRHISKLHDKPGNIVVVGGGISGSEAAATAAFQISTAKHSPGEKPAWANSVVHHITNKPFYCLTRYLPLDPYNPAVQDFNLAPTFLPDDLVMYNLSRRGDGTITASNDRMPPEKAKKVHEWIRTIVGGDQRDIGRPELVFTQEETQFPAFNGITDTYTEFVRTGLINPVRGRTSDFGVREGQRELFVNVEQNKSWQTDGPERLRIDNVVGIIDATGFDVFLPYLPEKIRTALEQDNECHRIPFLLTRGSIFNPNIDNLAFVGFYEGPFWGVMEMQSRLIAKRWTGQLDPLQGSEAATQIDNMRQLRTAIKRRDDDVPQFWAGDYVGLMEDFAREIGIPRDDEGFGTQKGPVFGARYAIEGCDREETQKIVHELQATLEASQAHGRFVAAAAFRAMQGIWTLQRGIKSRSSLSPGGTLKGTAYFHPRLPTSSEYAGEYLYVEQGTFTMDNGFSFPATRRYVYRYNEETDKISAWFVKEDGETVERFFNQLDFLERTAADREKGWIAKGSHWCDPDTYKSSAEFRFRGAALQTFGITYDVSGPKKDYTMESWYSRPAPDA